MYTVALPQMNPFGRMQRMLGHLQPGSAPMQQMLSIHGLGYALGGPTPSMPIVVNENVFVGVGCMPFQRAIGDEYSSDDGQGTGKGK